MLRASAAAEAAGVPTASLVCEGFLGQAATTSIGLGIPTIPLATVPGHPGAQTKEELRKNIIDVTVEKVIANLTQPTTPGQLAVEHGARDIVVKGGFDAINRYFLEHEYSDGLPIVPPTLEKIEAFLKFTDRDPDEKLGIMLPDSRVATIWSIAVNGVMAGCRPEYMPVLIALVEAMIDPDYGVEHSGNTPGGETLIILNGPIIKQLKFNYEQGVLRDGFQPNTSVGRFWRLYTRNVAGFLLHKNDKSTFGNTWRVVCAENEDVLQEIGWDPINVDMGFEATDNTVTITRHTGGNLIASVSGGTPEEMMPYLADAMARQNSWQFTFTMGSGYGTLRPMLLLGPVLARTIARAGWSKQKVQQYLFDHARIRACDMEKLLREWTLKPIWNLAEEARLGRLPKVFHESDDPNRMIPLVFEPEDYMIVVTGDPARTNALAFAHNGCLANPVAKKIGLPKDWAAKLAAANS